jgi:hypothetical protein
MDRIREQASSLPDLSDFLNLDNPVNPVYILIGFVSAFFHPAGQLLISRLDAAHELGEVPSVSPATQLIEVCRVVVV